VGFEDANAWIDRRRGGAVALVSAVCSACMIDLPPPLEGSGGDGGAAAGATSSASSATSAGGRAAGGAGGLLEACAGQSCEDAACAPEIVATVANGKFRALAVDGDSVYVANDDNHRLYRFDKARYRAGDEALESIGPTGEIVADVAVDDSSVYFASSVGIYRFEKPDGAPVPPDAIALPFRNGRASRMVLDQDEVFWVRFQSSGDPPAPADCLFSTPKAVSGGDGDPLYSGILCRDLAMDESWLYVLENEGRHIGRIPKEGGTFETVLSINAQHNAIEVDDELIYATTTGTTVRRLSKTPPHAPEAELILQKPYEVARAAGTTPSMLYFTNYVDGGSIGGVVGETPFNVATNAAVDRPERLAVDAEHVYWTIGDESLLRAPRCPSN
jgi:hypothetical protein